MNVFQRHTLHPSAAIVLGGRTAVNSFTDADRLARVEREARLLAAFNHSTIGGFEESVETRFLILELVEGDTLAEAQTVIDCWTRIRTAICRVTRAGSVANPRRV
jgi:hypothetical protein